MHVQIASSILGKIKSRKLDKLQDIEEQVISTRKITGENLDDLIEILGKSTKDEIDQIQK